jgi:hypothetical protein
MKRQKTSFGYELSNEHCTIKVLTKVSFGEKTSSYVVYSNKDTRSISTRSIKSARIIAEDFEEYHKIYNRKKPAVNV